MKDKRIGKYVRVIEFKDNLSDYHFGVVEKIDDFNNAIIKVDKVFKYEYYFKKAKTWYGFFHITGDTDFIQIPIKTKSERIVIPTNQVIYHITETTKDESSKLEKEYNKYIKEGWMPYFERYN